MDTWQESEGGWSIGVVEYWKKAEFIPFSIRCVKAALLPVCRSPNTPLRQHSIPSTLWCQVADDVACFDGPRDELVFLRQVDCCLKILLRNPFFEDWQPDLTGQIRIQAGPLYHGSATPFRIRVNRINAPTDCPHKGLTHFLVLYDPFFRSEPTGDQKLRQHVSPRVHKHARLAFFQRRRRERFVDADGVDLSPDQSCLHLRKRHLDEFYLAGASAILIDPRHRH